mmetsp:Transcript_33510/g.79090  ORF Transcript_33510/g.79090 Transcript_33510/m.79090 type:complete len:245 (-) Transcript_33510:967-1701(-)
MPLRFKRHRSSAIRTALPSLSPPGKDMRLLEDQRASAIAASRGKMVWRASEASTVSPHCSPPPPITFLHSSSGTSWQMSTAHALSHVTASWSRYQMGSWLQITRFPAVVTLRTKSAFFSPRHSWTMASWGRALPIVVHTSSQHVTCRLCEAASSWARCRKPVRASAAETLFCWSQVLIAGASDQQAVFTSSPPRWIIASGNISATSLKRPSRIIHVALEAEGVSGVGVTGLRGCVQLGEGQISG